MTAPAPAPAKAPSAKRAKKVVESEGIAHISATFNNLLITITDMRGNTLAWGSAGKAGLQGLQEVDPVRRHRRRRKLRPRGDEPGSPPGPRAGAGPGQRPRVGHSGAGLGRAPGGLDPRRHADSPQRVPSAQEAAGLSHVAIHRTQLPPLPPRGHQAVPQGHQVPHREVPGRAAGLSARASTARAAARRAQGVGVRQADAGKAEGQADVRPHRAPVPQHLRRRHAASPASRAPTCWWRSRPGWTTSSTGWASPSSRKAARQLIRHGHIQVNGEPGGHSVVPGRARVRKCGSRRPAGSSCPSSCAQESARAAQPVSWISVDSDKAAGRVTERPTRDAIPINAQEQLIVELYSK